MQRNAKPDNNFKVNNIGSQTKYLHKMKEKKIWTEETSSVLPAGCEKPD